MVEHNRARGRQGPRLDESNHSRIVRPGRRARFGLRATDRAARICQEWSYLIGCADPPGYLVDLNKRHAARADAVENRPVHRHDGRIGPGSSVRTSAQSALPAGSSKAPTVALEVTIDEAFGLLDQPSGVGCDESPRIRRYARRAWIILLAEDHVGYPNIQDIADGVGCLPQMVRTWVNRWRTRSRNDTSAENLLRNETRSGRHPKYKIAISDAEEILASPPPAGMIRWTVRSLCRSLGLDPSTPALHTVRKIMTVCRKIS